MMLCSGHSLRQDGAAHCLLPGHRHQHIAAPARYRTCFKQLIQMSAPSLHPNISVTSCCTLTPDCPRRQQQHLQLRLSECQRVQVRCLSCMPKASSFVACNSPCWLLSQRTLAEPFIEVFMCCMQSSCRSRLRTVCAAEVKTSDAKQAGTASNGKAEKEPEYYEVTSCTPCFP